MAKKKLGKRVVSLEKATHVTVPIEVHNKNFLCLWEKVGDGTFGKEKFEIGREAMGRATWVEYKGKNYVLSTYQVAQAILKLVEAGDL